MRLHHYGYVVSDIRKGLESFQRTFGAAWDGNVFEDPLQKVKVAFLSTNPGDAQFELVEPVGEDSPVYRFLTERGGGLHHACWQVANLDEALAEMRGRGCLIAKKPQPAVAFAGRRIAWLLTPEKLLVELLES